MKIVSRPRVVLGLASPVGLPIIGVLIQQRWTLFHYPEINVAIPVGLFVVGVVTGLLLRSWWSSVYILALGVGFTTIALFQEEYPGSESHAIAVALLITIVPLMMLGSVIGLLLVKAVESWGSRRPPATNSRRRDVA
ncbi:MAG: hypothetical protein ACRD1H_17105 [Vicinamibacterales bacterium]